MLDTRYTLKKTRDSPTTETKIIFIDDKTQHTAAFSPDASRKKSTLNDAKDPKDDKYICRAYPTTAHHVTTRRSTHTLQ
jgi:hypothetical protein